VRRKELELHLLGCSREFVECPFAVVGCLERPLRGRVEKHLAECQAKHARLQARRLEALESENRQLRSELERLRAAIEQACASLELSPREAGFGTRRRSRKRSRSRKRRERAAGQHSHDESLEPASKRAKTGKQAIQAPSIAPAPSPADSAYEAGVSAARELDHKRAFLEFSRAAELGSLEALPRLADYYLFGFGAVRCDERRAFELCELAWAAGIQAAAPCLKWCLQRGHGCRKDERLAERLVEQPEQPAWSAPRTDEEFQAQLAEGQWVNIMVWLGSLAENGATTLEALCRLRELADKHRVSAAQYTLWELVPLGTFDYLRKAAEQGHAPAMAAYGEMTLEEQKLRRAAERGYLPAVLGCARLAAKGGDRREQERWLQCAAGMGHLPAWRQLRDMQRQRQHWRVRKSSKPQHY